MATVVISTSTAMGGFISHFRGCLAWRRLHSSFAFFLRQPLFGGRLSKNTDLKGEDRLSHSSVELVVSSLWEVCLV